MTDTLSFRDEIKILGMAAPAVISMLRRKREECIGRLISNYRQGVPDLRNIVAELSTVEGMLSEMNINVIQYEKGTSP